MATAAQFLGYWALAFVTLGMALVLLSLFYRFLECDLNLHGFWKEAVIAAIASAVQGAGYSFSASLFNGDPFRRLVIPEAMLAIIYWLALLEDWSGYEIGGIAYFQAAILVAGLTLVTGQFKFGIIMLALFAGGLAIIASIAKSL